MSKIDCSVLANDYDHYPYRPDRRDLRVRLAKLDMWGCRNTPTSGGNDLVCPSWHALQNPFAAEMSKINFSVLANNYNYCPYRSDRRDLRIRLAKVNLVWGRNTSTSGGNDLVSPSWHIFTKPICGRFWLLIISYMITKIFYLHNYLTFKIHVCSLGNPSGCLYWHTARIKVHYIRLWSMKNVNTMTSFKNQIKIYVCKNDFLMVDRVLRRQCGSPIRLLSSSCS